MQRVNLMIGRFQPFTKGHYKCVEEAWRVKQVPTVICMIEVKDEKVDQRHPFPTSMLVPIYKEIFKNDKHVVDVITLTTADPVKAHEKLGDDYQICSVTCGTDRFKAYQWMYKYKEQANLSDDFELIEIKRGDEDISATKVRQALIENDKATFTQMTPAVPLSTHLKLNYYDTLRNQLLKVYDIHESILDDEDDAIINININPAEVIRNLIKVDDVDKILEYLYAIRIMPDDDEMNEICKIAGVTCDRDHIALDYDQADPVYVDVKIFKGTQISTLFTFGFHNDDVNIFDGIISGYKFDEYRYTKYIRRILKVGRIPSTHNRITIKYRNFDKLKLS